MTRASPAPDGLARLCYLPLHGVIKRTDNSAKIRVVFNGSSRLASGESLNQHLLTGPNLLPRLLDVVLRWRLHEFAMVADIEKMYRQVLVHPDDQDLQRILWRSQDDEPLQEFRLATVTYGLACAPYLAIRTIRQLADDEGHRFAQAAAVLRRDIYVDDILTGADSLEEASAIRQQLSALCTAGGFPLRKWSANQSELLSDISPEHRQSLTSHSWEADVGHSTLGLQWHPRTDTFSFQVRPVEIERVTKRTVLSQTARLFDPLGWLAPVTISAKILIQSAWLQGLGWDDQVVAANECAWRRFQEELLGLSEI
ncbi:PREDICTED: uncharacterized protein LOC105455584 [Wasmannia auropunctata]|uniref:uncharacterized protein LOC105455584 n=1 Tax=Wasmannia auropunctata TaxID=64793 RepID=UPI0005EE628F|nr:PREDICTED: uncharacterized protein LOC105455584 [Wasmannia auropunctata]